MTTATRETDAYSALFAARRPAGPAWLDSLRREAIARFEELGFPTTEDEEWRHTSVLPIRETRFEPGGYDPAAVDMAAAEHLTFGGIPHHRLVFVNGHFSRELSQVGPLPQGVRIESLADALDAEPALLEPHLGRVAGFHQHSFAALNTALFQDGALVLLPRGAVVREPIHLLHVAVPGGAPVMAHPRALLLAGEASEATIVESYVGLGAGVCWTNAVTEAWIGETAVIDHCKVQRENLSAFHTAVLEARLERSSVFTTHAISVGADLMRNDINAWLGGEGCEATLNGVYMAAGRQHMDTHTRIDHAMPHCPSHEVYRGILDGRARGVFNGRIHVHPGAQKTDAKQTNQNLLLSDDAQVITKPQLEIYADDVRCTHGATVGQLSADAIFYLRSRGIGLQEARSLLTYAFASDIVERIKVEPLRKNLESAIFALRGGAEEMPVLADAAQDFE